MSYFEKNITILQKKDPALVVSLKKAKTEFISVCDTKTGDKVPLVTLNEGKRPVAVHSKFDPDREAARLIDGLDLNTHNLFVVIGFGFGYHVQNLLERINGDSLVLAVEKELGMLKAALTERDLTKSLSDERLLLLVDPDEDIIAQTLKGRSSRSVVFVTHRGSFQIDQDYYSNVNRLMRSYLSSKEVNIATLAKFEKLWTLNCAKNALQHISLPGAKIFYEKFEGLNAIIIGAGPSLRYSLEALRQNQNSVVMVALDTSYKILIENGITPHFCLCVDPQLINARYFEGVPERDTVLVADPTAHPSVFRLFKGPQVVCSMPFDTMKWLEEYTGEKGEVAHGGSVSTNAYDFAKRLGVNNIYLVGQDLSFTERLAHCRGSYLDEMMFVRIDRFFNQEMINRRQLTALPKIMVPSIDGEKVHTNQKMVIFQKWFEKRNDAHLFNSSVNGIKLNGIKDIELNAAFTACENNVSEMVKSIYLEASIPHETKIEIVKKVSGRVVLLRNENNVVMERLENAVNTAEQLIEALKKRSKQVGALVTRLDTIDEFIASKSSAKSMIGMSIQRTIHTITEGYDTDEFSGSGHEKIARKSLFLYKSLLEGCLFAEKVLNKSEKIAKTFICN